MQNVQDPNPALTLDAEELRILERREAASSGVPLFAAHWHIFIPTLAIGLLYSLAWLVLAFLGKSDSGLARLFIVVMAVGVPLLAAHAFLRFQTIRLQVNVGHLLCHPGWPKELPIDVPPEMIESVRVRRGLSGRLFGGGTVVIELVTGNTVAIADLAEPEKARAAIMEVASNAS